MTRLPEAVLMVLATGDEAQDAVAIARTEDEDHEPAEGIQFELPERSK